ncbi:hypothetical protein DF220_06815 [Salinibacterium hongtaonis]|uniref:O-antigen ligase domain-containing protein n=1 Tax=Homoserinimonas hongtaonis TaxID=2079791 RepID=A0A2U1T114_9MICO|nr:hypothetical protein DF220_06815 [Salinibacterium hongtaonis]
MAGWPPLASSVFIAWLAIACFVPYWFSINIGIGWSPASLAAVAAIVVMRPWRDVRPVLADALLGLVVLSWAIAFATGDSTFSSGAVMITQWGFGYVLGRTAAVRLGMPAVSVMITLVFCLVAALAFVEFATVWNPFVDLAVNNSLYATWGSLQERGGVLRAEGAFGHSIALGASLALVVPLVLTSPLPEPVRFFATMLVLGASTMTVSRTGMTCAAIALVLSVLFLREAGSARLRISLMVAAAAVAVTLWPPVSTIFDVAGDEASASAEYRGDLIPLMGEMKLLGQSPAFLRAADGSAYFGGFRSIDSSFILTGLSYGIVPLLMLTLLLAAAVIAVLRSSATPATVAIVAQIPALFSVALITQYTIIFWLVAGLAVSSLAAARRTGASRTEFFSIAPFVPPRPTRAVPSHRVQHLPTEQAPHDTPTPHTT